MEHVKSTDYGIIYKLDDDDKRRYNSVCDYFIGNRYYSIHGDDPKALEAEMRRCMESKTTIIH